METDTEQQQSQMIEEPEINFPSDDKNDVVIAHSSENAAAAVSTNGVDGVDLTPSIVNGKDPVSAVGTDGHAVDEKSNPKKRNRDDNAAADDHDTPTAAPNGAEPNADNSDTTASTEPPDAKRLLKPEDAQAMSQQTGTTTTVPPTATDTIVPVATGSESAPAVSTDAPVAKPEKINIDRHNVTGKHILSVQKWIQILKQLVDDALKLADEDHIKANKVVANPCPDIYKTVFVAPDLDLSPEQENRLLELICQGNKAFFACGLYKEGKDPEKPFNGVPVFIAKKFQDKAGNLVHQSLQFLVGKTSQVVCYGMDRGFQLTEAEQEAKKKNGAVVTLQQYVNSGRKVRKTRKVSIDITKIPDVGEFCELLKFVHRYTWFMSVKNADKLPSSIKTPSHCRFTERDMGMNKNGKLYGTPPEKRIWSVDVDMRTPEEMDAFKRNNIRVKPKIITTFIKKADGLLPNGDPNFVPMDWAKSFVSEDDMGQPTHICYETAFSLTCNMVSATLGKFQPRLGASVIWVKGAATQTVLDNGDRTGAIPDEDDFY